MWALIKDFGNCKLAPCAQPVGSGRKHGSHPAMTINGVSYDEELLKFDDKKMFFAIAR